MSWTTVRFGVAIFWLAVAAIELRGGVRPGGVTSTLVVAALAVIRRSEEMPERRHEGATLWAVLAGAIAVAWTGHPLSFPLGALAMILWVALAVLIWRRFYPMRRVSNA